ncbi:hypothetical protein PENTCL1PPCAC_15955, partial [Pristionchus entomophagus]
NDSVDSFFIHRTFEFASAHFYIALVIFLAPFNIVANLLSAFLLLILKDLRNPCNLILSLMCFGSLLPLLIRTTLMYRKITSGEECSVETMTYSMAVHMLVEYVTWAPLRSTYTWLTVILTFFRFRALRSNGRWEASYVLAVSISALVALLSFTVNIPTFMTNFIEYQNEHTACRTP